MTVELTEIGDAIRQRRKSRRIMQNDLAEIAGISPRTLRDIERGVANPELATLLKLLKTLGMELTVDVINE